MAKLIYDQVGWDTNNLTTYEKAQEKLQKKWKEREKIRKDKKLKEQRLDKQKEKKHGKEIF